MTFSPADIPPIQTLDEFEAETTALIVKPFVSKFGAVRWKDMAPGSGPEFQWLVEDMIPEGGIAMIAGMSQSGKTFLALDLAMAVARGLKWFGKNTARGGVVYFAAEDPSGVRALRIPAYREANSLSIDEDVPFVLLTERLNLWESPERAGELIEECKALAADMPEPLRLIVIDTYAKATIGADELSGKEMSIIMDRMERINRETGATVLVVDHMNASGGRVRGVAPKTANIDAVLICRLATKPGERRGEVEIAKDADGRKIRELTNDVELGGKVKNGSSLEKPIRFVLKGVNLGTNSKGKEMSSCVVRVPSGDEIEPRSSNGPVRVSVKLSLAMKSLVAAIALNGRVAPAHVPNAPGGNNCTTLTDWRDQFAPLIAEENEDPEKLKERAKKARDRAIEALIDRNYIKKHGDWVWRTGKTIPGIDRPEPSPDRREPSAPPPSNPALDEMDDLPF